MIEKRIPVIFDGAMGTQIESRAVKTEDYQGRAGCVEILNITRPDVILDIHRDYFLAGAHVVETNTLGANRSKLGEYGLAGRVHEINTSAALIARKARDMAGKNSMLLVCGSVGPTGYIHLSEPHHPEQVAFDQLAEIYEEQARGLIEGGVDMLLLETMHDLLEVRAAIFGIRRIMREKKREFPLLVQVSMDAEGRMLLGGNMMAFLGAAGNFSPAAIGLNCGMGPFEMRSHIEELLARCPYPVSMMPNAGMPHNIEGKATYTMSADEFVRTIVPLVTQRGLAIVGGCCGTTPDHIRALSGALTGKTVAMRAISPQTFISSGITGISLEEVKKPIIIGERLNTQGSKKTKELVLARNFDELFQIALDQAKSGGSIIDLCMAINERDDEKEVMACLVSFLSLRVTTPFCIDSTEASVFENALKACPGAVMINSVNFERLGDKARPILALARDFRCPVIALTIDDEGMAKTVERKIELARRIRDLACGEFGLPERFIYIDPLTFTLATGDPESEGAAEATLEAVSRIKGEMPGIRTILGVTNVSYGLKPPARRVLNNLMLYHAVKAGLDAAIFNPMQQDDPATYAPAVREAGENLIFNRSRTALADFVFCFEGAGQSAENEAADRPADIRAAAAPERQLHLKITKRDRRGLKELIELLLSRNSADEILNTILIPAMSEVGEKMSKGEMILPFVLQAAEIMKESLSILEPHRAKSQSDHRGVIVLATVYGDVHDIGKNLVGSILKSQGYSVIDLGKQVPVATIVERAVAEHADAIGLSALLVTTSREMKRCVEECDRRGLSMPIIIGGAAVGKEFSQRIGQLDGNKHYAGGVFYAKDAFEAIRVLDALKKAPRLRSENDRKIRSVNRIEPSGRTALTAGSSVRDQLTYGDMLVPPFYGTGEVLRWEAARFLDSIDAKRLFKGYWAAGNLSQEEFEATAEKIFKPALVRLREMIRSDGLLEAKALYGFFSVYTDHDTVFILDPDDFHTEIASFIFPRMPKKGAQNRSIADYFRPEGDVIAIQAVTIGGGIGERAGRLLKEESRYSDGFFLNGIGNYLTEELARRVTVEIQRGLILPRERGKRYSFGYPGLPGLEEQVKLMQLLGVEDRLDITLTPGFQMQPEHSTIGIFVHHHQAEYY